MESNLQRIKVGKNKNKMIISLIVGIVVISLAYWLLTLIPLPPPAPVILKVIFIVVLVLYVLQAFGLWGGTLF